MNSRKKSHLETYIESAPSILESFCDNPYLPSTRLIKRYLEIKKKPSPYLACLPDELLSAKYNGIGRYLDDHDLSRLRQVSHRFDFFQKEVIEIRAKKLLEFVLKGNYVEAKKIIRSQPELLLIKTVANDYSDHSFKNMTAFQAALCVQDVEMWKMLEECFKTLANGQEAKAHQFDEVFPHGLPVQQVSYDFTSLVAAINNSTDREIEASLDKEVNDSDLCQELQKFRREFTDLSMNEHYFNPQHLRKAFDIYDEHYQNWTDHQRDLFWRQVIGFVQRFLPPYFAQVFSQGLSGIVDQHYLQQLMRIFNFKYSSGTFYPLDPDKGLGFDFALDGTGKPASGSMTNGAVWNERNDFIKLCRKNESELNQLQQRIQNPPTYSWCPIL